MKVHVQQYICVAYFDTHFALFSTEGYLHEVCKQAMGPGGFMCVPQQVMQRSKVTDDAFGDKKLQQQNLEPY